MTIFGWDGSHYDWDRGPMDLTTAVADGIEFFTHKASEGSTYTDPRFAYAMARARNAGMPLIGAYCVNRRGDQRPQVDKFMRVLDSGAPFWRSEPFIVQLDCERWSNKDGVYAYEPSLAEIHAWCDYFMERSGGRLTPIVYAPKWVYGDTLRGLRYPLWASSYGSNPTVPYRQAYPGDGSSRWAAYSGITPAILQYGSRTTIGAQTICDANAFRGTLPELRALISGDDDMSWLDETVAATPDNPGRTGRNVLEDLWTGIHGRIQRMEADARAARAAEETRDRTTLAAIQALAGNGGPEVAPIVAAIKAEGEATRAQFEQAHQAELAERDARMAGLQAELDRLRAGATPA